MAAINPTVDPMPKTAGHPVSVNVAKVTVEDFTSVYLPVQVMVRIKRDIRNIIDDPAVSTAHRCLSDRYVETLYKAGDVRWFAVGANIRCDREPIAWRFVALLRESFDAWINAFGLSREGILHRARHPHATVSIEIQIHRLSDVGFRQYQLNFKSRWKMKLSLLLFGRLRISWCYVLLLTGQTQA